jgi:hypothetical protein
MVSVAVGLAAWSVRGVGDEVVNWTHAAELEVEKAAKNRKKCSL